MEGFPKKIVHSQPEWQNLGKIGHFKAFDFACDASPEARHFPVWEGNRGQADAPNDQWCSNSFPPQELWRIGYSGRAESGFSARSLVRVLLFSFFENVSSTLSQCICPALPCIRQYLIQIHKYNIQ